MTARDGSILVRDLVDLERALAADGLIDGSRRGG